MRPWLIFMSFRIKLDVNQLVILKSCFGECQFWLDSSRGSVSIEASKIMLDQDFC